MAEYQRSRHIDVAPDDVFAFVSDLNNLPTFLPTVTGVAPRADGRIHVSGEVDGRHYEDDGRFNVEPARRRVEWNVPDREYAGWLSVHGDDGGSQVVVRLSMPPYETASGRPVTGAAPPEEDPIERDLDAALDSLRNLMEGLGGKVAPRSAGLSSGARARPLDGPHPRHPEGTRTQRVPGPARWEGGARPALRVRKSNRASGCRITPSETTRRGGMPWPR